MTVYIKLSTLEYPLHEGDIRAFHPEIREDQTWPNFPLPEGYALVRQEDPPSVVVGEEMCHQTAPVQINGEWVVQWQVVPLSDMQKQFLRDRQAERDAAVASNPMGGS